MIHEAPSQMSVTHESDSGEGSSIAAPETTCDGAAPFSSGGQLIHSQCDHANGILQYCGVRSCLLLEARMVEHQEQGAHPLEA